MTGLLGSVRALAYNKLVWGACVLGGAYGVGTLAAVACLPLVAHQWWTLRRIPGALAFAGGALALGGVVDSTLGALGVIRFADTLGFAWLVPPWMLAIWAIFVGVFVPLLGWLRGRPLLAALLGGPGGALAYGGGAALGAATLPMGAASVLIIGGVWMVLLPLLAAVCPAPRLPHAHQTLPTVKAAS